MRFNPSIIPSDISLAMYVSPFTIYSVFNIKNKHIIHLHSLNMIQLSEVLQDLQSFVVCAADVPKYSTTMISSK